MKVDPIEGGHPMRYPTWFAAAIVSVLCVSCMSSGTKNPVVLEPVGPRPLSSYRGKAHGFLKVYSATDAHGDGDTVYYPHTAYSIYSEDGKLVKKVRNANSSTDEEPDLVTLPEGSYAVEAEAEHQASVKVPVIIEGGRLTSVHLDGDWKGKDVEEVDKADLVKLPDGEVVGWRAGTRSSSKKDK